MDKLECDVSAFNVDDAATRMQAALNEVADSIGFLMGVADTCPSASTAARYIGEDAAHSLSGLRNLLVERWPERQMNLGPSISPKGGKRRQTSEEIP